MGPGCQTCIGEHAVASCSANKGENFVYKVASMKLYTFFLADTYLTRVERKQIKKTE
jgi:hypothetical protein